MKRTKEGVVFAILFLVVLTACESILLNKKEELASRNETALAAASTLVYSLTATVQKEATLPTGFSQTLWSPNGEHIALAALDGSIWQIDYPNLNHLEQLTYPLVELITSESPIKNAGQQTAQHLVLRTARMFTL